MAEIKHLIETDYKSNYNNMGERIEAIEKEIHDSSYMKLTNENVRSFKVGTDSNGVNVALDSTNSAMKLEGQTLVNFAQSEFFLQVQLGTVQEEEDYMKVTSVNSGASFAHIVVEINSDLLKPNTTYTLFYKEISHSSRYTIVRDATNGVNILAKTKVSNDNKVKFTTLEQPCSMLRIYYQEMNIDEKARVRDNLILLEGDWTNKNVPLNHFEGLQSVGEEVELKQGKNMFDISSIESGSVSFVANNPPTIVPFVARCYLAKVKVSPKTTYTLNKPSEDYKYAIQQYDANNLALKDTGWASTDSLTLTTLENTNFLYIPFHKVDGTAIDLEEFKKLKIQLEEGSVATNYVPYKGESTPKYKIEILSTGKNLLNFKEYHLQNEWHNTSTFTENSITVTTDTSKDGVAFTQLNFYDVPKGTYWFSCKTIETGNTQRQVIFSNLGKNGERINDVFIGHNGGQVTVDSDYGICLLLYSMRQVHSLLPEGSIKFYDFLLEKSDVATECEEYKANKTEILLNEPLRSLPSGIKDSMEIKDGKLIVTRRCGEVILNGSEYTWVYYPSNSDEKTSYFDSELTDGGGIGTEINCISDKLTSVTSDSQYDLVNAQHNSIATEGVYKRLRVRIDNSKLATQDLEGFLSWLKTNNITVIYQLETPILEEYSLMNPTLYKDGHVFLETGVIPCSSVSHEVALNTKAQVKSNSKAIVSARNMYDESLGFYDGMLLELDYDHTVFDFEYNINKMKLEEV